MYKSLSNRGYVRPEMSNRTGSLELNGIPMNCRPEGDDLNFGLFCVGGQSQKGSWLGLPHIAQWKKTLC